MQCVEVSGSDADAVGRRVAELTTSRAVEVFDASTDKGAALASQLGVPSLFGAPDVVVVRNANKIVADSATALAAANPSSQIVFTGEKPMSAAVRKRFTGLDVESFNLPNPRNAVGWCRSRAADFGVELQGQWLMELAPVVADPVGAHRFDSSMRMLASSGKLSPSEEELSAVMHGVAHDVPVWAVSDAVARGDVPGVVQALEAVEPIAALSVAASRLAKLGLVLECPELPEGDVSALVGGSPYAVRMLRKGVSAGLGQVHAAFAALVDAEFRCRDGRGDTELIKHVVLAGIVEATRIMAGSRMR